MHPIIILFLIVFAIVLIISHVLVIILKINLKKFWIIFDYFWFSIIIASIIITIIQYPKLLAVNNSIFLEKYTKYTIETEQKYTQGYASIFKELSNSKTLIGSEYINLDSAKVIFSDTQNWFNEAFKSLKNINKTDEYKNFIKNNSSILSEDPDEIKAEKEGFWEYPQARPEPMGLKDSYPHILIKEYIPFLKKETIHNFQRLDRSIIKLKEYNKEKDSLESIEIIFKIILPWILGILLAVRISKISYELKILKS